jgi:hypothetical protein
MGKMGIVFSKIQNLIFGFSQRMKSLMQRWFSEISPKFVSSSEAEAVYKAKSGRLWELYGKRFSRYRGEYAGVMAAAADRRAIVKFSAVLVCRG